MSLKIQYDAPFSIIDRAVLMSEELSVYDKTVYAILCSYANSTDRCCYSSYQTIARKSGCSRRKVIDVIDNLERMGLVEKQSNIFSTRPQIS